VADEGLTAGAVEDFGAAALHACAETGGENHDGNGSGHPFYYDRVGRLARKGRK
jgi:hypothetical protein